MSNRKLRTARSDFLYMMAREGKKFFSAADQVILNELLKDGLIQRQRTQASNPQGSWRGDRRRNTFYEITDSGWELLRRRGGSMNQNIRVHQKDRNVPFQIDRYVNRLRQPAHEVIEQTINYPAPGEIKVGIPMPLEGRRRRQDARRALKLIRAKARARRAR
jgi:DNA-binding MarR family transcriptional regulator